MKFTIKSDYYRSSFFSKIRKFLKRFSYVAITVVIFTLFYLLAVDREKTFATPNDENIDKNLIKDIDIAGKTEEEVMIEYFKKVTGSVEIAQKGIQYAIMNDIEPSLIFAIMKVESNFNPFAKNYNSNGTIDRGLCQLNSETFKELRASDFFDIDTNISKGVEYIKWCLKQANGNLVEALAYYNAGIGNVNNDKVKNITINYIDKILYNKHIYENELAYYLQELHTINW